MAPKRKRGPYKQYLLDPTLPVPRSTLWFRKNVCGDPEENELPDHAEENLPNAVENLVQAEALDPVQHLGDVQNVNTIQDSVAVANEFLPRTLSEDQNSTLSERHEFTLQGVSPNNIDQPSTTGDYDSQSSSENTEDTFQVNQDGRSQNICTDIEDSSSDESSGGSSDSDDNNDNVHAGASDNDHDVDESGFDTGEPNDLGEESSAEEDWEDNFEFLHMPGKNLGDEAGIGAQDMDMAVDEGKFRQPLYNGAQLSSQESDILIMSFIIRWGLEDKAIEDLLRLIDCHMPAAILGSKYLFLKKFPTGPSMQTRYFCPDCSKLLPSSDRPRVECECGSEIEVNALKQDGSCFVQFSVSEQVQHIMTDSVLVQQMRKECTESDVISGKIYKRLRTRGIIGDDDVTLQWNTDGVKPFKSSEVTIYPVQAAINELPLQTRRDKMLLCGLYYGKGKPDLNVILKPFVEELTSLHHEGVDCDIPNRGLVNVKVHTLLASVDSVARPMLQGIMQFNGRYGCSFCLRRGKCVERGRGRARVYVGGAVGFPRTLEQHVRALESLEQYNATHRKAKTNIQGVKRGSILLLLPIFNVVKSFVPEYLHAALEGVVVTFWKHWSSSEFEGLPWHLTKQKRMVISTRLQAIRPPVEVTRPPKSLDDLAIWKASEIRSFLLYYSLVCMKGILPRRYLKHWFLFVYAMTVFLKERIVREQFLKAQEALVKFVEDIARLYPNCYALYTFNTHLLLHVPKAVADFGALWGSSTFPYEHFNGVLTRLIAGTQSVPIQICRSFLRLRHVTRISSAIFAQNDCSESGKKLYKSLLSNYHSECSLGQGNGLRLFGKPLKYGLSLVEQSAVEQFLDRRVHRDANSFRRMIIHGKVFHSAVYNALSVRDNSYAQTNVGELVYINRILLVRCLDSGEENCLALCNDLQKFHDYISKDREIGISSSHFVYQCHRSDRIIAIRPSDILFKCVGMLCEDELYVSPLVNSLERD